MSGVANDALVAASEKLAVLLRTANVHVTQQAIQGELEKLPGIIRSQTSLIERLAPSGNIKKLRRIEDAARRFASVLVPPDPSSPASPENDPFCLLMFAVAKSMSSDWPEQYCGWDGVARQKLEEIRSLTLDVASWARNASAGVGEKKQTGRGGARRKAGLEPYAIAFLMGAFERLTGRGPTISNSAEGQPSGLFVDFCLGAMAAYGPPVTAASVKGYKEFVDSNPQLFQYVR
ncbi:MAG: hypothetical protein AB1918_10695 [Pseudomonadota bacterium]